MRKILFSGELPPRSIHGVSYSNETNLKFLKEKFEIITDEEFVAFKHHNKFNINKTKNFFKRIFRVAFLSLTNKFSYFYIVFSTSTIGAIKTLIIIIVFKTLNRSKVIVHIHRGDLESFILAKSINKSVFDILNKFTYTFIVLSDNTKFFIKKNYSTNAHVLDNTVNFEYQLEKVTNLHPKTDFHFIYISNYIKEKGILLLLDVFKQLPDNFKLNCYGNFTDQELKEVIQNYQSTNISINGPIEGELKYEKISQSDALILPSYNEGKPLVLLEAMSVGTILISSDVGYIKEMVYCDYPFLYSPNIEKELSNAIFRFSNDKNIYEISKNLKQHYNRFFSHSIHREQLLAIFE